LKEKISWAAGGVESAHGSAGTGATADRQLNQQIEKLATEKYPESELLRQPWGVGAITSVSYRFTIEDKTV